MKKLIRLLFIPLISLSLITSAFAFTLPDAEYDATKGNDAYTVSLLHMNGTDASTTFTDDAAGGTHTWTANGNAQIDTAAKKFGTASGEFDGDGDYLTSVHSADWYHDANFTIDFWIKLDTLPGSGQSFYIYTDDDGVDGAITSFYINETPRIVYTFRNTSAGYTSPVWPSASAVGDFGWHHIAVTRAGDTYTIWEDGVSLGSADNATAHADLSGGATIGRYAYNASGYVDGHIDEFRISKGIARDWSEWAPVAAPAGQMIRYRYAY